VTEEDFEMTQGLLLLRDKACMSIGPGVMED
jgi:hypothetical protein